jgi:hypothetical protein
MASTPKTKEPEHELIWNQLEDFADEDDKLHFSGWMKKREDNESIQDRFEWKALRNEVDGKPVMLMFDMYTDMYLRGKTYRPLFRPEPYSGEHKFAALQILDMGKPETPDVAGSFSNFYKVHESFIKTGKA